MSDLIEPMLSVHGLSVQIRLNGSWQRAVDEVSFDLARGEALCLVGESGCGKSLTIKSLLRLYDDAPQIRTQGTVRLGGRDLFTLDARQMRSVRGAQIGMIFQEPLSALNPVLRIGEQIGEPLHYHRGMERGSVRAEVLRLLELVRIPRASDCIDRYPHELSGGMRQRVMIATAIACKPTVLLADEPTTALDATNQAQVLHLLRELQREIGMALILVTHDLGVAANIADRVAVMYAGELVELAAASELFARPSHPYTGALLRSLPRVDRDIAALDAIPGSVPAPGGWPACCRFAERCSLRLPRCEAAHPELTNSSLAAAHVRCVVRGVP